MTPLSQAQTTLMPVVSGGLTQHLRKRDCGLIQLARCSVTDSVTPASKVTVDSGPPVVSQDMAVPDVLTGNQSGGLHGYGNLTRRVHPVSRRNASRV